MTSCIRTTQSECGRFVYDFLREVFDHLTFDLIDFIGDARECARLGQLLDDALTLMEASFDER